LTEAKDSLHVHTLNELWFSKKTQKADSGLKDSDSAEKPQYFLCLAVTGAGHESKG
jgi:hypothetical protein